MPLSAGDRAPDFELTWVVGRPPVRRSTYQNGEPLVLLFFPLAYSPACTEEFCRVRDDWAGGSALGAKVLGVSVDSPWVNARFADDVGIDFPLLSDFNRTVARDYGVLNPDFFGMEGVADRAAFVIDGDGVVRWSWHTADADVMPDFAELQRRVAELSG